MPSVPIRILALAAFASLPMLAQQPSPTPQPPASSSPQATPPQQTNPEPGASQGNGQAAQVPSTANSPEIANPQLRPVTGELQDKLDTKTAKNGDSVVVKTTEAATTATGVEIPKGSKITGHIIDVAAKGAGGENSRVTIQFDQAEIKDGQTLKSHSRCRVAADAESQQMQSHSRCRVAADAELQQMQSYSKCRAIAEFQRTHNRSALQLRAD